MRQIDLFDGPDDDKTFVSSCSHIQAVRREREVVDSCKREERAIRQSGGLGNRV